MKKARQRVKHIKSFEQRLLEEAARFRGAAPLAQAGTERELLLRRMRQFEDAARMNEWLTPTLGAVWSMRSGTAWSACHGTGTPYRAYNIMTSDERYLLEITASGLLKLEHNINERVAMIEAFLHALFRHKGNTQLTLAWLQVQADV